MKRPTKKTNKTKYFGIGLLSLAAVGVFSIGFATWVVGADHINETQDITVNVSDVQTESLTATVADTSDTTISFGPSTATSGGLVYANLSSDASGAAISEEDLTATIVVNFTSANRIKARDIVFTPTYSTAFQTAITNNYIVAPFSQATTVASLAVDGTASAENGVEGSWGVTFTKGEDNAEGAQTYTLTLTLNFKWGSAFNGANPILLTSGNTDASGNAWTATALGQALESLESITTGGTAVSLALTTVDHTA